MLKYAKGISTVALSVSRSSRLNQMSCFMPCEKLRVFIIPMSLIY